MRPMPQLQVVEILTEELLEYPNNSKLHPHEQVEQIAKSIEEFGFNSPILAWHNDQGEPEIVAGHGRLMAAKKLGMDKLPVVFLDHMTEEQRRAYILVDNQLTMNSGFEEEILAAELSKIADVDMSQFDFDIEIDGDWFTDHERNDTSRQDGNREYNEFLDKFEAKKTTDDCYTPDIVYDAVADWVADEYGLDRANFVRPFYPNGDYQREKYPNGCAVVDNPPFSILTEILRFYVSKGIKFFLFAPTLTLFTGRGLDICYLPVGVGVTYENGASVNTSFITNMEDLRIHVRPDLYETVKRANDQNLQETRKELLRYEFPSHVVTAAGLSRYAVHGVEFELRPEECQRISALDSMKEVDKALFGGGFLLSDSAAKRNKAAEIQKEENKRNRTLEDGGSMAWALSDREREIIASLGRES